MVGGPQPTVGRGIPPQLDVLCKLLGTPALESLSIFLYCALYLCSVFLLVQGVVLFIFVYNGNTYGIHMASGSKSTFISS